MGKKLHMQRRGKGSPAFKKPVNHAKTDIKFGPLIQNGKAVSEVIEFIDDPGHTAPIMLVRNDEMSDRAFIAPEGIKIGDKIQEGPAAQVGLGSVLTVNKIPEGMPIYNIEVTPGDGGKLVRSCRKLRHCCLTQRFHNNDKPSFEAISRHK